MIPQSTETAEPLRQIEVVRCHCKSIIAGQVLPVRDEFLAEWEADKRQYARRGYTVSIVQEAAMGSCKCKEVIASLEAQVAAMREAGQMMREHLNYAKCPTCAGSGIMPAGRPNTPEGGGAAMRMNVSPCTTCDHRRSMFAAWEAALLHKSLDTPTPPNK